MSFHSQSPLHYANPCLFVHTWPHISFINRAAFQQWWESFGHRCTRGWLRSALRWAYFYRFTCSSFHVWLHLLIVFCFPPSPSIHRSAAIPPLHFLIFFLSPSPPCGVSIWRSDSEGHSRGRRERRDWKEEENASCVFGDGDYNQDSEMV